MNNIGIVDEAQLPDTPYNINHIKDMFVFVCMGIVVSFAYIVIIYLFDNTIKKEEDIEEYIKNIQENNISKNITIHEEQTEESTMNEYMLLGLRMIQGININEFKQKFKTDPTIKYKKILEKLQKENLIQITKASIKLTKQGIDFGNIVWEEFL